MEWSVCVLAGKPGGREEDGNLNELKWACPPFLMESSSSFGHRGRLLLAGNGRNGRRGEEIFSFPPDGLLLPLVHHSRENFGVCSIGSRATSPHNNCRHPRLVHVRNPAASNSFTLPLPPPPPGMHLGRPSSLAYALSLSLSLPILSSHEYVRGNGREGGERDKSIAPRNTTALHTAHMPEPNPSLTSDLNLKLCDWGVGGKSDKRYRGTWLIKPQFWTSKIEPIIALIHQECFWL